MASEGNNIEKVQFFSLTGSKLPLCEIVGHHRSYPVLVQINDDRVFALNFTEEMQIQNRLDGTQPIHEEEHYYDFARDIGLRGYELFS